MPFQIVRNDLTNMEVDAIVNTASPWPTVGAGLDAGVHQKAGPRLLEARKKIGSIPCGGAAITPGFDLPARYVIHTVGPVWEGGGSGEEVLLASCYRRSLRLAAEYGCESIAFPLIATGNYGFPKALALQIAVREFSAFLPENDMLIYLVVFGRDAFELSEKLFASVSSYIDEHYILQKKEKEYGPSGLRTEAIRRREEEQRRWEHERREQARSARPPRNAAPPGTTVVPFFESPDLSSAPFFEPTAAAAPPPTLSAPAAHSLDEELRRLDAGFSETLLRLIDKSGKKDSEIYKKANVDRKLFSKIRNNPDYRPSKATALAFALALELSLPETRDFILRAGYALSHSSKFDVIVEYFITTGNYNVMELNEVLFKFDQPLIGA